MHRSTSPADAPRRRRGLASTLGRIAMLTTAVVLVTATALTLVPRRPSVRLLDHLSEALQQHHDRIGNERYALLIDYDAPVYARRLWLVDLASGEATLNAHVGHAFRSGWIWANDLSNVPGSEKSSSGAFVTAERFEGRYGLSLRLDGLDHALNGNARARAIILHKSPLPVYSRGCFTTSSAVHARLLDLLGNGALVFVHRTGS